MTFRLTGAVFASAVLAAACLPFTGAALPTPLPPQEACRVAAASDSLCILILGDSIGEGVPLSGDDRWWVQLERHLARSLPGWQIEVDSWALSGSRVDVLESAARDQASLTTYDIAIVIEGVNDVGSIPLDEWSQRYRAAVETMESRGLLVILGAPPPSFEDGVFKTLYDPVADAVRGMARADRPVLDIAGRWHADGPERAGTYYADLIHQGPIGQRLMAEMARELLIGLSLTGARDARTSSKFIAPPATVSAAAAQRRRRLRAGVAALATQPVQGARTGGHTS